MVKSLQLLDSRPYAKPYFFVRDLDSRGGCPKRSSMGHPSNNILCRRL